MDFRIFSETRGAQQCQLRNVCDGDADRSRMQQMPQSTLKETCDGEEESEESGQEKSQEEVR